jgi:hypothetical protein
MASEMTQHDDQAMEHPAHEAEEFAGWAWPGALIPASVLFATQRRDRRTMTARPAASREVTAVGQRIHSQPAGSAGTLSP